MGLNETSAFDDVKEAHCKDSGRTWEEIESLTVDEHLNDLQRIQLFLSPNSHQLQQTYAFEKLPIVFNDYGTASDVLFPILSSSLDHFNPNVQVMAGNALQLVMQGKNASTEMASCLLPLSLRMINSNNIDVLEAWMGLLCLLVSKLPLDVIRKNLLHLAMVRGKVEETATSRAICSRLLGAIAPMFEQEEIENTFLNKAMALCQDTDAEVRISMCNQLNSISRAVGINVTKKTVLPELYDLLKDEEVSVHSAALTCLVDMLDFLPPDVKRTKILPILRSLCNQRDAKKLLPLCVTFGQLMVKMVPDLPEDDVQLFVESYKQLSRHDNEDVRQLCAYSFPSILKSIGPRKYAMTLHLTYQSLVQDGSSRVRSKMAIGYPQATSVLFIGRRDIWTDDVRTRLMIVLGAMYLHGRYKVVKILGKERVGTYLREAFLSLLTDASREVQKHMIFGLQQVIGQFAVSSDQQRMDIYTSMLPHLLQADKDVGSLNMWRLQTAILETFSQLIEYLSSDQIYEFLAPVCFYHMTESVLPVRSAAAVALAKIIRNNRRAIQRFELSHRVVKEFGHGRSYTARLVYIDFCESFISNSSSRMFKEYFLDAAISILQDEVVAVRMRACALLPQLKTIVKLPEDAASLERINFYATQRLNDNDKQVAAAAKSISDTFKQITVRCVGVETSNENFPSQVEFETVDKQREEEEWNMLPKEEQDEQKRIEDMLQRARNDGNKKAIISTLLAAAAGAVDKPIPSPQLMRSTGVTRVRPNGSVNTQGLPGQQSPLSGQSRTAGTSSFSRSTPMMRSISSSSMAKNASLQQSDSNDTKGSKPSFRPPRRYS